MNSIFFHDIFVSRQSGRKFFQFTVLRLNSWLKKPRVQAYCVMRRCYWYKDEYDFLRGDFQFCILFYNKALRLILSDIVFGWKAFDNSLFPWRDSSWTQTCTWTRCLNQIRIWVIGFEKGKHALHSTIPLTAPQSQITFHLKYNFSNYKLYYISNCTLSSSP